MIILTLCLAVGLSTAPIAVALLLTRAHASESLRWAQERRELLNRIQRPEQIPLVTAKDFVFPEIEPDEINEVGTITYQAEEVA